MLWWCLEAPKDQKLAFLTWFGSVVSSRTEDEGAEICLLLEGGKVVFGCFTRCLGVGFNFDLQGKARADGCGVGRALEKQACCSRRYDLGFKCFERF